MDVEAVAGTAGVPRAGMLRGEVEPVGLIGLVIEYARSRHARVQVDAGCNPTCERSEVVGGATKLRDVVIEVLIELG
jgi:hypothetical protein